MAAEEVLKGQLDCDEVSPRNRFRRVGSRVRVTDVCGTPGGWLSLSKMLSGANAFEISDIERMTIGGASAAFRTMLHALWLPETTIRQGQADADAARVRALAA